MNIHHKVVRWKRKLKLQKQYQELDIDFGFYKEDNFKKLRNKNKKISNIN